MPFTIEQRSKIVKLLPPNVVTTKSLHSRKCTAWCALSSDRIIGPYWFEDNAENAVTVNQENYRHVIKKFTACLRGRRFEKKLWFQQDGATPHTAVETRKLLSEKFEEIESYIWAPHLITHWNFFCGATQKIMSIKKVTY